MPTEPIRISPGKEGQLIVRVPYSPERVAKIKTVAGRRWHQGEKYWTVPHTDDTLRHLLALFARERVELDPSLCPVNAAGTERPSHEPASDRAAATVPKLLTKSAKRSAHGITATGQRNRTSVGSDAFCSFMGLAIPPRWASTTSPATSPI
jgi:hypothetical protein